MERNILGYTWQPNQAAVLRTAECLGVQHVWIVEPLLATSTAPQQAAQQMAATLVDADDEKQQQQKQQQQPKQRRLRARERRKVAERAMALEKMEAAAARLGQDGELPAEQAVGWYGRTIRGVRRGGTAQEGSLRAVAKQAAEWLSVRKFGSSEECIRELQVRAASNASKSDCHSVGRACPPRRLRCDDPAFRAHAIVPNQHSYVAHVLGEGRWLPDLGYDARAACDTAGDGPRGVWA
eukprot:SAG11_NODE_92_length_17132_cov_10.277285_8_plen_238_part_00